MVNGDIKFYCPNCGKDITGDRDKAGRQKVYCGRPCQREYNKMHGSKVLLERAREFHKRQKRKSTD